MDNLLKENERLDDLEINNLRIIQNPKKFCFGIDAVLLSDFAKIKTNTKLVDFCTGNAIIPLLISAKYKPANISAIEYQDSIFDMAKRSIIYNKLENFIELINGDIRQIKQYYKAQSFDYVTCNPPYMENNKAIQNTNDSMKIARHEITCTIEDVIYASSYVLKNNGTLYMVHRPNRLVNLMKVLNKYKLEVKKLRFVHSKIDKKANLVLIEAVKGAGSWLDIEAPLIVYNLDNTYTQEILKIYGKL